MNFYELSSPFSEKGISEMLSDSLFEYRVPSRPESDWTGFQNIDFTFPPQMFPKGLKC
jgi:hypothetical protein